HAIEDLLDQRPFIAGACDDDACTGRSETVAHHGESGCRPAAASVAGTRVEHGKLTVEPVEDRCRLLQVVIGYDQAWLEGNRRRIQQRRHLEVSEDLMLVVQVR